MSNYKMTSHISFRFNSLKLNHNCIFKIIEPIMSQIVFWLLNNGKESRKKSGPPAKALPPPHSLELSGTEKKTFFMASLI